MSQFEKNVESTKKVEIDNFWNESLEVGFLAWIEKHGYSEKSKLTYKSMIEAFFAFLEKYAISFEDVNKSILELFFRERDELRGPEKKLSERTKGRYLWLISDIYEDMIECGFINVNNVMAIKEGYRKHKRGKSPKRLPVVLSGTETKLLERYIEALPKHYSGMRERCSLLLLLGTGLREQELCDLETSNMHLDDEPAFLRIIGKFDKERAIPIPETIVNTLLDFKEMRNKSSAYFLSSKINGKKYSPSGVYRMVHTAMKDAGIDKGKMSPHVLRHTYCTRQLSEINKTGSEIKLQDVQRWMGHDSFATTAIYDHVVTTLHGARPVI